MTATSLATQRKLRRADAHTYFAFVGVQYKICCCNLEALPHETIKAKLPSAHCPCK